MDEMTIAKAILEAQRLREASWNGAEYSKKHEECFIDACKALQLPDQIWFVLHLANHWCNDLNWWATEIEAGKNIHEGMVKVAKGEQKQRLLKP